MKKPIQNAKEKAGTYKADVNDQAAAEAPPTPEDPPQTLESWNDLVGQRIEEAMRQGMFDNLPGHGKPLDLRRNPFVPADQEMAFHLLEINDAAPGWIGERKAMLQAIEQWRNGVRTMVAYYQKERQKTTEANRHQLQARWNAQLEQWTGELRALNKRIQSVNLAQPIARLEIFKLLLDEELTRAGVSRVLS